VAPCATFFFDTRARGLHPGPYGLLILFHRPFPGFLGRESQAMEHLADMVDVVPHAQVPPDDFADTSGGPGGVGKAVCQGTLLQEGADLLLPLRGQAGGPTRGGGGLQATLAFEPLFPGVDGVDRDAEVIRDLLVGVSTGLHHVQGGESPLFELSAGVLGGVPRCHVLASLAT